MGRERAWRRDEASDGDVGAAPEVKAIRAGRSKEGDKSGGKRDSGRELPPRLSSTAQVL
jgi:hypothetical protein